MSAFENEQVVREAEATVKGAIDALFALGDNQAVIGRAPAGAGKSYAICTTVEAARMRDMRVAVATPTNEQAFALVSTLADRLPGETVTFVHAQHVHLPEDHERKNVSVPNKAREAIGAKLVVGTLNKLGDAFARADLRPFDVLLIDEAFQANAVHYYLVGDLAPRHLLMGDSGQLAPFSSAPDGDRWRGLSEDPLLTAVEVLRRNHPKTREFPLPISRRLDPRAVPIAQAFYPDHPFESAILPGVRELLLSPRRGDKADPLSDAALEISAKMGWAHVELPATAVVTADPETISVVVAVVQRLFARSPRVKCERHPRGRALQQGDVAVAVSHNDQKNLLRVELQAAGLPDVVVNTANKLQGLTFEVVVAWHPLAGLTDADEFHLDPGRLCVMLTRHRQACIVVGRAGDRQLVEGIPPATPSYVGWDSNQALDGWYVHEGVFRELEAYRIT